jgi:glycosyltransferase involved in cell wall biosynthesis
MNAGLIVIPAYNEELTIARVVERVRQSCPDFDLIVVNDGSTDATRDQARRAGAPVISHPINLGYGAGLQTGIRYALERGYDWCVFIDADGQHDPADIHRLEERMRSANADLVIGSRFVAGGGQTGRNANRRLGMLFFSAVTRLLTQREITDTTSGFKLLTRQAMTALRDQDFGDFHSEIVIYLLLLGMRVEEVPIRVVPRQHGRSMYSLSGATLYPFRTLLAILVLLLKVKALGR